MRAGVLRAPYPRSFSAAKIREELKFEPSERRRYERMLRDDALAALEAIEEGEVFGGQEVLDGGMLVQSNVFGSLVASLFTGDDGPGGSSEGEDAQKQVLWWIKSLRDDPLRLVRTLRFAATLQFRVHGAFWRAVPFAVDHLATKVSGPRKVDELRKIAKAGLPPLLDFFDLAFSPLVAFGEEDLAFGDALFGGPPADGGELPERISVTAGFDSEAMRTIARALPEEMSADGRLGAVLAAAIISCDLRVNGPCAVTLSEDGSDDGDDDDLLEDECAIAGPPSNGVGCSAYPPACDAQMRACLEISTAEVRRACEGLGVSQAFVNAAEVPLVVAESLLRPPNAQGQHAIFAAAAAAVTSSVASSVDGDEFAALQRTYELLKLDPAHVKRRLEVGNDYILALLRTRCAPETHERFRRHVQLLSEPATAPSEGGVSGKAVAALEGVPPHLRGSLMSQINVLVRLRGDRPVLGTMQQLEDYLETRCDGLLSRLRAEWVDESGELRPCYSKKASGAWLHGR